VQANFQKNNKMRAILTTILVAFLLVSCQTNTLQTYMIDSKEDENFISLDFSLKTFVDNFDDLPEDQKELFKDVNKVNFLAFKKNGSNDMEYKTKQTELSTILSSQFKDNQLMAINSDGMQVQMYADNLESTVEEIIVYANAEEQGFMVVRLLGDDLNPANFYKMMKMSDDMSFDSIEDLIKNM